VATLASSRRLAPPGACCASSSGGAPDMTVEPTPRVGPAEPASPAAGSGPRTVDYSSPPMRGFPSGGGTVVQPVRVLGAGAGHDPVRGRRTTEPFGPRPVLQPGAPRSMTPGSGAHTRPPRRRERRSSSSSPEWRTATSRPSSPNSPSAPRSGSIRTRTGTSPSPRSQKSPTSGSAPPARGSPRSCSMMRTPRASRSRGSRASCSCRCPGRSPTWSYGADELDALSRRRMAVSFVRFSGRQPWPTRRGRSVGPDHRALRGWRHRATRGSILDPPPPPLERHVACCAANPAMSTR
jgi:hypothetical protein